MIASVVATLQGPEDDLHRIIEEVSRISCVEVGDIATNSRRVPMTIASPDPNALEEITRRLQECRGVAFVDVVFVHFEDALETGSVTA